MKAKENEEGFNPSDADIVRLGCNKDWPDDRVIHTCAWMGWDKDRIATALVEMGWSDDRIAAAFIATG